MDIRKILMINHDSDERGGASKCLTNLSIALAKNGYKVVVAINGKNDKWKAILRENGVETIFASFYWWKVPSSWPLIKRICYKILRILNLLEVSRISRYCNKNDIGIIHSNSSVFDLGSCIAKKINGIHIWHHREFGDLDMGLSYICGNRYVQKNLNNKRTIVLAVSNALLKHYSYISNIVVCYDGVEKKHQNYKKHSGDYFNLIISGRISRFKGQLQTIQALNLLLKQNITNWHLFLYGLCLDKEYFDEINDYINTNDMKSFISICGYSSDIENVRKNMDIEIVASKSEAFGLVTVEAMQSSLFVIGSDKGSCLELIENDKTGLVFCFESVESLSECIKKAMSSNDYYNKITSNAYKYACYNFSVEKNCLDFISFLNSML